MLAPLEARRAELAAQRSAIEEAVLARAAAKAAEWESRWSRPAVSRTGTTEEFALVEARYVRLVVSGRDNDPRASAGFKLDEFEVWTADGKRNVALASAGGHADGRSPVAEDFGGAYLPDLTIYGKFGQ